MTEDRKPNRTFTLAELADQLPQLIDWTREWKREFVIIEIGSYFVQFTGDDDGPYAEAVGNYYLAPINVAPLTGRDDAVLLATGWHEPNFDEQGHGNYWRQWGRDASAEEVAAELLLALITVFMRGEGGTFRVFANNFDTKSRFNEVFG